MRVVECNICGETISAAGDGELVGRVTEHLRSEHGEEPAARDIEAMVADEAYEATDS